MITQIPITQSMLDTRLNHLYPYICSIVIAGDRENINIDRYAISGQWFLNMNKIKEAQQLSGLSYKSFRKYAAPRFILYQKEFIALMPRFVWVEFADFLKKEQEPRSWNSWTKLFCYIYFNCAKHIGCSFSHSREQFQQALGMQGTDLSYKLKVLEQKHFLSRTNYNADQGIARSYVLPERYWPEYRQYQQKLIDKA